MTNESYRPEATDATGEDIRRQMEAALNAIHAIAETIRELDEVPSGELYARLMGKIELHDYEQIIATLKRTGLVTETPAGLLRWNHSETKCK
jgi:uncharacterized protein Yka (UPF0111/DUF47 family)